MKGRTFAFGFSLLALVACLGVLSVPPSPAVAMQGSGACEGDLDGDGFVGVLDLLTVLADFGCMDTCDGDANGDGTVGVPDLLLVLANFGLCDESAACSTNADCDDGNPCTIDVCIGGVCHNFDDPDCDG